MKFPLARRNRAGGERPSLIDSIGARLAWLESPLATYYLILSSALLLVGIGLVMVLSASSVTAYVSTGSAFSKFKNQAIYGVLGLIVAFVISRLPLRVIKGLAGVGFLGALALQALTLVPGIGKTVNGNTNWIGFGSFQMQPSELGKVALCLVCAVVLENRRHELYSFRRSVLPVVAYCAVFLFVVMLGGDLGTTMVIGAMAVGMLWTAGAKGIYFALLGIGAAIFLPLAVLFSGNRTERIRTWWAGCTDSAVAGCYQQIHGSYALADGGLWGLGPGASREKWQWLPEAHNDFIFAIIGEELGLPGTLAILALYLVLAFACYRLIAKSDSMFVRVATGGIMAWLCVQAVINIGSVIGLLPIIGVPLPLVSYGGTALVVTLMGVGLLLAFARSEPAAAHAFATKPRRLRRTVAIMPNRKDRS